MKRVLSKIKGLFYKKTIPEKLNTFSTSSSFSMSVGTPITLNNQQIGTIIGATCAGTGTGTVIVFAQLDANNNFIKELETLKRNIIKQPKSTIKSLVELNIDEIFYTVEHRKKLIQHVLEVTEETPEEILYLSLLGCKLSKTDLDKVLFACRFEYPLLVKYVKELNEMKQEVTL